MKLKDALGTDGLLRFQRDPELGIAVSIALDKYLDWQYLPWSLFYNREKDPNSPSYMETADCVPLAIEVSVNGEKVGTLYVYEALEMILLEVE